MKNILKAVLLFILSSVFMYLVISFYYININPVTWEPGARYILSFWFIIAMAASVAFVLTKNKKQHQSW